MPPNVVIALLLLAGLQGAGDPLQELSAKAAELRRQVAGLDPDVRPDVEIYLKAVEWALRFPEELYTPEYVKNARLAIARGMERAGEATKGSQPSWATARGRLSRGYRSRVDGSVQPCGLVIPGSYHPAKPIRLDVWLHGRGATLTEVSFLAAHDSDVIVTAEQDYIQLDVFGRGNNAYRWAGETDVFEAIDSVRSRYNIDPDRIVLRGFSMGGAGAWHIGLHHPSRWAAVEAGAGFTETPRYAKLGTVPDHVRPALHIYDAADYALNAWNVPIVGYGGDQDPQLQASVNVREALEREGVLGKIRALFLAGPGTAHKWHPESKRESEEFIARSLPRRKPDRMRFVTWTPRYGECFGVRIEALERLYERAEIDSTGNVIRTVNVGRLSLESERQVTIDGQKVRGKDFEKRGRRWRNRFESGLRKRAGLQGPIDDAFLDSFLCVRPDSESKALDRFTREWAKWMRGDLRVKRASEVTAQDIRELNLVLFGTPRDNPLIARIAGKLPVTWKGRWISAGRFSIRDAALTLRLIYPNPLNPDRYVVLNSGHSFGEEAFKGSNALLFPRWGDFAITDDLHKDRVRLAGFFDERWRLPAGLR